MHLIGERTLFLDDENRLGETLDADAFRCNWEWWLKATMLVPAVGRDSVVRAKDALALADRSEPRLGDDSWRIHLHVWGDRDATTARQFIAFLRGGGFSVIDVRGIVRQN
jgi:hypothetical protein